MNRPATRLGAAGLHGFRRAGRMRRRSPRPPDGLGSARATDLTPPGRFSGRPVSLESGSVSTQICDLTGDMIMAEDEADLTGATPRRRPKPSALEIGGRRLKPSTLMMGYGYDPALSEGSLKPPIFLTSTFVFENAAAGKRHLRRHHRQAARAAPRAWSIRASTAPTRRSSRTA